MRLEVGGKDEGRGMMDEKKLSRAEAKMWDTGAALYPLVA